MLDGVTLSSAPTVRTNDEHQDSNIFFFIMRTIWRFMLSNQDIPSTVITLSNFLGLLEMAAETQPRFCIFWYCQLRPRSKCWICLDVVHFYENQIHRLLLLFLVALVPPLLRVHWREHFKHMFLDGHVINVDVSGVLLYFSLPVKHFVVFTCEKCFINKMYYHHYYHLSVKRHTAHYCFTHVMHHHNML